MLNVGVAVRVLRGPADNGGRSPLSGRAQPLTDPSQSTAASQTNMDGKAPASPVCRSGVVIGPATLLTPEENTSAPALRGNGALMSG